MNKIEINLNGKDVNEITASDLDKIFVDCGYTENGFEKVKFLGISESGSLMFLTLTYCSLEEEWLVSVAFVTSETVDFLGMPEKTFSAEEEDEAFEFFNNWKH